MRKKNTPKTPVDEGFEFGTNITDDAEDELQTEKLENKISEQPKDKPQTDKLNAKPQSNESTAESQNASIDIEQTAQTKTKESTTETERQYSKYYTPHPKVGAKGGTIGKPPVKEKERKRSVSIQLSNTQKERYNQAAIKDRRKWPDFVITAIEEYIEKHNLE